MTTKEIWDYVNSLHIKRIKTEKFWGYININDEYVPEVIITSKDNYYTVIIPKRVDTDGGFSIRFTITKEIKLTTSTCDYNLRPVEVLKKRSLDDKFWDGYDRFAFYCEDSYIEAVSENLLPLIRESKLKQIGIE